MCGSGSGGAHPPLPELEVQLHAELAAFVIVALAGARGVLHPAVIEKVSDERKHLGQAIATVDHAAIRVTGFNLEIAAFCRRGISAMRIQAKSKPTSAPHIIGQRQSNVIDKNRLERESRGRVFRDEIELLHAQ